MKIVLWVGNEGNQKALAHKINDTFPIDAIIIEKRNIKRKITTKDVITKVFELLFFRTLSKSWWQMLKSYEKLYPDFPNTNTLIVENINSNENYQFTKNINPDLIIVSGTRLVKDKMLSLNPSIGIINLHTGLSPYIKGAPNCTNWCIATKQFHLIGNTVMWLDKGIDSGNIIATEFTSFNNENSLFEVHLRVMNHAHDLYLRAIQKINSGIMISIPQDTIGKGITYYNKQWTLKEKIKTIVYFKIFLKKINSNEISDFKKDIKTFPI